MFTMIKQVVVGFCLGSFFLAGCAYTPLLQKEEATEEPRLADWHLGVEPAPVDPRCRVPAQPGAGGLQDRDWGELISCQQIEILDARPKSTNDLVSVKLQEEQGCSLGAKKAQRRVYVNNRRAFFFLDEEVDNRTVWFVPDGYVTDGQSIPHGVNYIPFVRMAFGSQLDPIHPKTLPASMVHDRYLCMNDYAEKENIFPETPEKDDVEYPTYRRNQCSNDTYHNILRTSGAARRASSIMRTAVGIFNAELNNWCPNYDQIELLTHVDQQLIDRDMRASLDPNPVDRRNYSTRGNAKLFSQTATLPAPSFALDTELADVARAGDCFADEPLSLCVTREPNLRVLSSYQRPRAEEGGWTDVFDVLFCFELQAAGSPIPGSAAPLATSAPEEAGFCRNYNINLDDNGSTSPFRAGDLFIEGLPLLATEEGRRTFVALGQSAETIDQMADKVIEASLKSVAVLQEQGCALTPSQRRKRESGKAVVPECRLGQ